MKRTLFAASLAALAVLCLTISSSAQEQPKPEPKPEPAKETPVPTGEKTDAGLKFAVPFKRGEGSVVFSRQNGYLRVDADIRLPYNAGDGNKSAGSGVALVLSVDGLNGRIFVNHPSPLWSLNPQALPPFRIEKSYARTGEPSPVAALPAFAAESNLVFMDRWTTTLWVNLSRVIIPGNTPDSPADSWRAAFTTGDEAAHEMLPTGINLTNPAQTPERMLTFKFTELPERSKLTYDPIVAVNKREDEISRDLLSIVQTLSLPRGSSQADISSAQVKAFNAVKALCKKQPDLLLSRYLAWQFGAYLAAKVEADPIALLKEYLDACPSQWQVQTTYLDALLDANRREEAVKRMRELLDSGLGKGFPPAEIRLKLDLAPRLADSGEAELAMSLYESALKSEVLKTDHLMRLRAAVGASYTATKLGNADQAEKYLDVPQSDPPLGYNDVRVMVDYTRMLLRIGYEEHGVRAARVLGKSKWLAGNPAVLAQVQLDLSDGSSQEEGVIDGLIDTNYGAGLARQLLQAALDGGAFKDNENARFMCLIGIARSYEAEGDMKSAIETYTRILEAEKGKMTAGREGAVKKLLEIQTNGVSQWAAEQKFIEEDAKKKNPMLTLETSKGTIVVELFEDDAPNTVASIVSLTQKKFYDGLTFHRFVGSFMIQGGDPNGNGTGGPGYALKSEVSKRNHFIGTFAMACSRPKANTEGSQFYICTSNGPSVLSLSGNYVVAGRVVRGLDVAMRLRSGDRMTKVTVENLRDHAYKPETLPAPK